MSTVTCILDKDRPRAAAKNGPMASLYTNPDKGYVVLDKNGVLYGRVVYLVYEQARKVAMEVRGRVVNRNWYERRMNCQLEVAQ